MKCQYVKGSYVLTINPDELGVFKHCMGEMVHRSAATAAYHRLMKDKQAKSAGRLAKRVAKASQNLDLALLTCDYGTTTIPT